MGIQLKICGMKYPDNIQEIVALGPDYMGFIFYRESKRYVEELAPESVQDLGAVRKVGVFVNPTLEEVQHRKDQYGLDLVQLHGAESPAFVAQVKALGVPVIKAFGISEDFDWSSLQPYQDQVDFFLFDTKSSAHGGTGRTFDWTLLSAYSLDTPYFLSGGLHADNIQEALALSDKRLVALDLNSRFEVSPGRKDVSLLKSVFSTQSKH